MPGNAHGIVLKRETPGLPKAIMPQMPGRDGETARRTLCVPRRLSRAVWCRCLAGSRPVREVQWDEEVWS
jgi:hypothetical protein